ncbi:hypothetical protein [Rhizobium leguminosarum]|uniref:hypothetical protein n=1 Tax=Rhizobium leguminosarum TaxID=384 RepID=UPI00103A5EC2|nr:hypothetical protein [Rhizobium leguminosarum]TCA03823.1 hypothetical protein E0H63_16030 [Rhizobium leguminosarum bv. viciae]
MLSTDIAMPATVVVLALAAYPLIKLWLKAGDAARPLFSPKAYFLEQSEDGNVSASSELWLRLAGYSAIFLVSFFAWTVVLAGVVSPLVTE